MLLRPNCKINIGLSVLGKRPDGYHNLDSIFYPVYGLADELEVTKAERFSFSQEGIVVDCAPEDNLIIRTYRRMRELYPQVGEVAIRFRKVIPFGAGLGGGSSDAAHMAIALNEIFGLGLRREQLIDVVRPLGADCAFFIYNIPCRAEGIGDVLTPVDMDLSRYRLLMIKPDIAISTREAYAGLCGEGRREMEPSVPVKGNPLTSHLSPLTFGSNDFERSLFPKHPELAQIKQRLLSAGAAYASMSGSGSTLFGLFELDAEGRTHADLAGLHKEFTSMVIFDDALTQTKS